MVEAATRLIYLRVQLLAKLARPERFELPTARFVAEYSIQLSYGRVVLLLNRKAAAMLGYGRA